MTQSKTREAVTKINTQSIAYNDGPSLFQCPWIWRKEWPIQSLSAHTRQWSKAGNSPASSAYIVCANISYYHPFKPTYSSVECRNCWLDCTTMNPPNEKEVLGVNRWVKIFLFHFVFIHCSVSDCSHIQPTSSHSAEGKGLPFKGVAAWLACYCYAA